MKTKLLLLIFLTASLCIEAQTYQLTIIHTNDFHGYDYDMLARKSTIIDSVRAAHPNVLLLEAGDIFSRGKYHRRFYGSLEMEQLNLMKYDAWAIGNNEMKCASTADSTDLMVARLIQQASFPSLNSQIYMKKDSALFPGTVPYVVLQKGTLKIGIVGTTSMKIKGYEQSKNKYITHYLPESRRWLAEVKPQSDIQIILSHSGIQADKIMADSLANEGLDAIVGGDTHLPLHEPFMSGRIPVVQAGGEKNPYVGVIELTFEQKEGEWQLIDQKGCLIEPKESIEPHKETLQLVERYLNKIEQTSEQK